MAASIKIPTEFRAIDKFSNVIKGMTRNVREFSSQSVGYIKRFDARVNNTFNKLGRLSSIALGIGIGGLFTMAIQNNIEYDKSVQSIMAVTGKSGKEFDKYRDKITGLGKSQKLLFGDVAKAMEIVGSAQPELLDSADKLAMVTDAALTLSKAGGISQEQAALSLTGVMNQYGAGADEAMKYIDILATSEKKGSSIIKNTAEALLVAGGTAKAFGLSFETSNAFIQAFAKGGKLGSEAGTMFTGVLSKLSKVQNKEFNPSFTKAEDVINNLKKANLSYTDLIKLTDSEGAKWITTLLNQNDVLQSLNGNLNDNGAAQEAANIKTRSFDQLLKNIKTSFLNFTTATDNNSKSMNAVKNMMGYVADNIDKVILVLGTVLAAFIALKVVVGIIEAVSIAMSLYTAITAAYSAVAVTAALTGASFAAVIWATVWPILAVIAAIAAVIAIFYYWDDIVAWFSKQWDAFTKFIEEFDFIGFFKSIGSAIFDFLVFPLQSVLKLVSKIPGMGGVANMGIDLIEEFKGKLGLEDNSKVVDTKQASNDNITKSITERNSNVKFTILDKGGNVGNVENNDNIPIFLSNTVGSF